MARPNHPAERRRSLLFIMLMMPVVVAAAAAGSFGWPWYQWATAGGSPYDEVGIDVNNMMPGPLHHWACARIAARFLRTLPPSGC